MLSLTAEYALRAVLYIADRNGRGPVRVDAMADAMGLPRNYLSKTLNQLTKRGVLASQRGPAGGFRLRATPETLTLAEVVEGFDPEQTRRGCLLGRPRCSDENPCPAHGRWKSVADEIATFFRDTTVADLLKDPVEGRGIEEALRGRRDTRSARS
jgi:Rrf2 family protein